jgi:hypothetical protein
MLDLKNIGLVELSAQEAQEIDGGWLLAVLVIAALLYSASAY